MVVAFDPERLVIYLQGAAAAYPCPSHISKNNNNHRSLHFLKAYYLSGTILSCLHILIHLIITVILCGRYTFNLILQGRKLGNTEVKSLAQDNTGDKW